MALGESTTGRGGAYSWSSQLETILNERSPGTDFKVINEGLSGTNTAAILSKLEMNLDKYSPHIVITMMGDNDDELYMVYENTLKSRIIAQLKDFRIYKLSALMWKALENPEPPAELADSRKEDRLMEMKRRLEESLQAEPDNGTTYADLGGVYQDLGVLLEDVSLLEEAEKMFRKAVELNLFDGRIYDGLGLTYKARGMYPEAIEAYEELINLSQAGLIEGDFEAWAYVQLGRLYYMGEQPGSREGHQHDTHMLELSEELFKKAVEIEPDNAGAYIGLGWVYYDLWRNQEEPSLLEGAEKMFRKAIELDVHGGQIINPRTAQIEWPVAYNGLGLTYEARRMYPEAIGTYERLIELSQTGAIDNKLEGWAYAQLGRLYHETGVPDEEIGEFYKQTGAPFEVPRGTTAYAYEITKHHYRELYRILDTKGIQYIAMQYPNREVDELKNMFDGGENILFVSNKENFQQALHNGTYEDYFIDRFAGDFGHATPKGNRLIAENVANVILTELNIST